MQNTDLLTSFSPQNRTRVIDILGKPVTVKNYICSEDGVNYKEKAENVMLQTFVCPTSFCPGNCPFCVAKNTKSEQRLDIEKFSKNMRILKEQNRVRGIKITGGEPFCDVGLLNEVISVLFEIFGHGLEISISTNGIKLDEIHKIKDLEYVDTIHISRHHYNDEINKKLFGGADVPSGEVIKEIVSTVSYKDLFVLNCLLLKDYINSAEEVHRFLDFAITTGVPKVGFMVCMQVNDFTRRQMIPYESVINDKDPSMLFTRRFFDYEFCHCCDGVYLSQSGDIIEFYARATSKDKCRYSRGLVYEADDHLKDGFDGNIIF